MAAGGATAEVRALLERSGLNTVCASAECPNRHECYHRGTATFMILGDICTRDCAFCAVRSGRPGPLDPDEPRRVAEAVRAMKLEHVVVTSVTRDDLPAGGAAAFAATIRAMKALERNLTVEVLTPDFEGRKTDVATVLAAAPDVFNHNLETVRRLQREIRPAANYGRSLAVLRQAAAWGRGVLVKSGLMVGLGEDDREVEEAMADLRAAGCAFLTIGQYLAPSKAHVPVRRYVPPEQFERWERRGLELGFRRVAAGPLVRSSYRAGELLGNGDER